MEHNEKKLKKAIIRSSNAIRKKYRDLHQERLLQKEEFLLEYKPIIDPLNKLNENKEQLNIVNNHEETPKQTNKYLQTNIPRKLPNPRRINFDEMEESFEGNGKGDINYSDQRTHVVSYLDSPVSVVTRPQLNTLSDCLQVASTADCDKFFGVRKCGNNYKIGQTIVKFDENSICMNNGSNRFKLTNGLKNLLFLKSPDKNSYKRCDLNEYKKILTLSDINTMTIKNKDKNVKFENIIKPLLKTGKGVQTNYKIADKTNTNSEYIYWDDPNELIDRLQLLVSSQSAGHTSHNNEIISIIEELREANIIY